jgi:hypothetical protein
MTQNTFLTPINRRSFLGLALGALSLSLPTFLSAQQRRRLMESVQSNTDKEATTWYIYDHLISYAKSSGFNKMPIGECMGKIGSLLIGTPYVGGTLEGIPEKCRVDLTGMDCVTFFENVLCISRALKLGTDSFADLQKQITYTRYRDGKLGDYMSRLHYTADWIRDNEKKGVIKDITRELGGIPFPVKVGFMSANPAFYAPLAADSTLIPRAAQIEQAVNQAQHYYIPKDKVKDIEPMLQTGDIVAIATNKEGLDYAHTGLIQRNEKGRALLLHASLTKKRVYLDKRISMYLSTVPAHTGITVLRPLEPAAG